MTIFTVISNYYGEGLFGSYTSIKRARKALEFYLSESDDIVAVIDNNDYTYQITTRAGEEFSVKIISDSLDWEFEEGIIKEDE
jgi:chloramphenicol O-acetyltransferase